MDSSDMGARTGDRRRWWTTSIPRRRPYGAPAATGRALAQDAGALARHRAPCPALPAHPCPASSAILPALPTCSEYAYEAIARHGLWTGGWMGLPSASPACGPGGTHGIDHVPERRRATAGICRGGSGRWAQGGALMPPVGTGSAALRAIPGRSEADIAPDDAQPVLRDEQGGAPRFPQPRRDRRCRTSSPAFCRRFAPLRETGCNVPVTAPWPRPPDWLFARTPTDAHGGCRPADDVDPPPGSVLQSGTARLGRLHRGWGLARCGAARLERLSPPAFVCGTG